MRALLLKGAKKVPKGTLFFIGQNGQLYMRSGPLSRRRRQIHVRVGISAEFDSTYRAAAYANSPDNGTMA